VLQKVAFVVFMGGGGRPMELNDILGIYRYLPPKHILWYIERQATLYGLLCRRAQGTKKKYMR